MSGQVASHTKGLPELHGANVTPSGLLPSDLDRPGGSSLDGIPAEESVRWMMSLTAACLGICYYLVFFAEAQAVGIASTLLVLFHLTDIPQ